jgi:hypothetical protein
MKDMAGNTKDYGGRKMARTVERYGGKLKDMAGWNLKARSIYVLRTAENKRCGGN